MKLKASQEFFLTTRGIKFFLSVKLLALVKIILDEGIIRRSFCKVEARITFKLSTIYEKLKTIEHQ